MTVATLYSIKDAQWENDSSTTSVQNATATTVNSQDVTAGTSGNAYSGAIFQMDFSSIPSYATVSAVTFGYTFASTPTTGSGDGSNLKGELLSSSWAETNGTTNPTRSGTYTGALTVAAGAQTSTDSTWLTWVQNWIAGTTANNGFHLGIGRASASATGTVWAFDARENGSGQPYFTITYATDTSVPTSTVQGTGWDTAPTPGQALYGVVDELVRSDTDYVFADVARSPGSVRFGMRGMSAPSGGQNRVVSYAYQVVGTTRLVDLTVTLYQTTTQIAQWTHLDIAPGTFVQADQTLTSGQVAAITDWTALRLDFAVSGT